MTKADFISKVAQSSGLTKKDATAATDAVVATITDVLTKGDSISFIGFGTFSTAKRAARTARDKLAFFSFVDKFCMKLSMSLRLRLLNLKLAKTLKKQLPQARLLKRKNNFSFLRLGFA